MMTYRHALGALLLLIWHWSGTISDLLYGHPAQRLIAAMEGREQPSHPLQVPFLHARIWLFEQVMWLMPERYGEEAP